MFKTKESVALQFCMMANWQCMYFTYN
uniref:Uncharacterized protein n=1 Tax=Arundo donax TaxID=35708 RepID=A0A0A8ZI41_ARUDO